MQYMHSKELRRRNLNATNTALLAQPAWLAMWLIMGDVAAVAVAAAAVAVAAAAVAVAAAAASVHLSNLVSARLQHSDSQIDWPVC